MAFLRSTCCIVMFAFAFAGAASRADAPPARIDEKTVRDLVAQLGDASFKVRDDAQGKLLEMGVAIRPHLLNLPPLEHPETRRRVDQILKVLFQRELARVRVFGLGYYTTNFGRLTTRSDVFAAAVEMIKARDQKEPSPAKRLYEMLDPFMKKSLEDEATIKLLDERPYISGVTATAASRKLHLDLRRSLEKVLDTPKLYDPAAFAKAELPAEAKEMLRRADSLTPLELRWLNYTLASAAFPDLLKTASVANGIVTIKVPESTQPIVLVLSAYESTIWKIEASSKSNLLQVIVGGFQPQEVVGVKVPVVYKVNQTLPGLQRNRDYFYSYTATGTTYNRMIESVRQTIGKGLDHFDGVHTYDGKPVVINPNQ